VVMHDRTLAALAKAPAEEFARVAAD
jgi:hypothetical protein